MGKLPLDTSVEAEYEDGFILSETTHNDISPYNPKFNILRAIIDKAPEAEHGRMVRFSVFYNDQRHDVDWTGLPDNARPIRFRNYSGDYDEATGDMVNVRLNWLKFGYQYTDGNGKNVQEVVTI